MLELIVNRLARMLPQPPGRAAVQPWFNEDSSWHSSSFDLARGLLVIEHRGVSPAVFVDTMPDFHRPEA